MPSFNSISESAISTPGSSAGSGGVISLEDSMSFSDTMVGSGIQHLVDALQLAANLEYKGTFPLSLSSSIVLAEAIQYGFQINLTESLTLSDSVSEILTYVQTLADEASFGSVLGWSGEFNEAFVSGIVLSDLLNIARLEHITDTVGFLHASDAYYRLILELASQVYLSDSLSNTLAFIQRLEDGLTLSDSLSWTGVFSQTLESALTLSGQITLEGVDYVAWVLNPTAKTFSSYEPFAFNSFVALHNKAFGFKEDGIYELEGDTDDGEDIQAKIVTGLLDFGTANFKNVRHAYLGMSSSGDVLLRTITTKKGKKRKDYYRLRPKTGDVAFTARKDFSNAVQARYWQFEIENVDGNKLMLDEIEWRLVLLRRKI